MSIQLLEQKYIKKCLRRHLVLVLLCSTGLLYNLPYGTILTRLERENFALACE